LAQQGITTSAFVCVHIRVETELVCLGLVLIFRGASGAIIVGTRLVFPLLGFSQALVCRQLLLRNGDYTVVWKTTKIEPFNQFRTLGFVTLSVNEQRQFWIFVRFWLFSIGGLGAGFASRIRKARLLGLAFVGGFEDSITASETEAVFSDALFYLIPGSPWSGRYFARGCFFELPRRGSAQG
jgi:hypothetical protein